MLDSTAFRGWQSQSLSLRKSNYDAKRYQTGFTNILSSIIEVAPPKVGMDHPAFVRAEIILDTYRLAESIRREWEAIRPEDTVYLLALQPSDNRNLLKMGHLHKPNSHNSGFRYLRTAEIVQLLDDSGRSIREVPRDQVNGYGSRQRLRRMIVNLDAAQFKLDRQCKEQGQKDVYESINLIVRRRGRENNFSRILKTIQGLAMSDVPVPSWLQEVFLGYGDPAGATFTKLTSRLERVDFRDTFLGWQHLVESLPGKVSIVPLLTIKCLFLNSVLEHRDSFRRKPYRRPPSSIHSRNACSAVSPRTKAIEEAATW